MFMPGAPLSVHGVDTMLVVTEPFFQSLETARRSFDLARDLGISPG